MIKHLSLVALAFAATAAYACPQATSPAQGRGITARVQDIGGSSFGVSGSGIDIKVGASTGTTRGVSAQASTSADRNGKTCGQCQKIGNVVYGNVDYGTKRGFGVSNIGTSESSVQAERNQHSVSDSHTDKFSDLRIDTAEPALPKQLAK